ncbi:GNAT family N-acetyltransferase [Corynebacterium sp. CCM 9204]|uniref:GNAT family N-acetyltransferase n=1 Tax=Corynebacterium sp. CCM 9204 TaxID=3057616 RepID=UPI003524E1E1
MRSALFTTPCIGTPPDNASDAVRHLTMMLGLHGQQVTGTTDASVSVASVLNALSDGPDIRVLGLMIVDDQDPDTSEILSAAPLSQLGYPLISVTGDGSAPMTLGWATVSVPLRENRDTCSAEITLDVSFLPFPGESLTETGGGIVDMLVREVEDISRTLGRTVIQLRQLTYPPGSFPDPLDLSFRNHGFTPVLVEEQSRVTIPAQISVPEPPPGYTVESARGLMPDGADAQLMNGLCRLLTVFSADVPTGELVSQPQDWDSARLARADADTRATGREVLWAVVRNTSGIPVAASALSRHPEDTAGAAAQILTVVDPAYRRRGFARIVKSMLARTARDTGINRIHTSTVETVAPIRILNAEWNAETLARSVYWQKHLTEGG